ncbi:hypothetical protein NL676_024784 [Syzygium grande]|nr:hypothetical protein NL676_024784 [Syzygium grande]
MATSQEASETAAAAAASLRQNWVSAAAQGIESHGRPNKDVQELSSNLPTVCRIGPVNLDPEERRRQI